MGSHDKKLSDLQKAVIRLALYSRRHDPEGVDVYYVEVLQAIGWRKEDLSRGCERAVKQLDAACKTLEEANYLQRILGDTLVESGLRLTEHCLQVAESEPDVFATPAEKRESPKHGRTHRRLRELVDLLEQLSKKAK